MELNGQALTLAEIAAVAFGDLPVQIAPSARPRILASRKVVEDIIARDAAVYGVSTGATPAASAIRSRNRKCAR